MTTNESIMKTMLERATTNDSGDELAIQMFCLVVQKDSKMIQKAQEMLLAKIRSHNVEESTRAIAVLEECMTKCGAEFQDEISKFRFLNELIRLVSKKYFGDSTPLPIKKRIMECLLLWTTEFPQKTKIRETYDMLNKEGLVEHDTATAKRECVLGIDEEMLSKLIKSGDPENFKRANLLIQYRVNQEARRTELFMQQKSELEEIQSTVSLLSQMLDAYEAEGSKESVEGNGNDSVNLMRELYLVCKNHKPILQRLPELIGNTDESLLAEALETNDALQNVMARYKNVIVHPPSKETVEKIVPAQDLLTELLGDMNNPKNEMPTNITAAAAEPHSNSTAAVATGAANNLTDELSLIFSNVEAKVPENVTTETKNLDQLFGSLDLLQPVNVFSSSNETAEQNAAEQAAAAAQAAEKRAFRELREIDKLSEELFMQSLSASDRVGSFKKKEPEKLTLNELAKEKTTQSLNSTASNNNNNNSSPSSEIAQKTATNEIALTEDDDMLDAVDADSTENKAPCKLTSLKMLENENYSQQVLTNEVVAGKSSVKPLSEIIIDLDELTPCGEERVLHEDDEIKITLNLNVDRPSKNVSVLVIAVANKSKSPIQEFHFDASVKKPCKLRLLPPTDTGLPPFKQYRPPAPINQIMLLLNPTGQATDVTCIFGYKLGEDPDPIRESVIAKAIPYVE